MRLETLYPNFATLPPEQQSRFVSEYRLRRAADMDKPPTTTKKKKASAKKSKIDISDEEKAVMKALGLSQKAFLALRALAPTQQEPEEPQSNDDEVLLLDNSFGDGEEDGDT